MNEHKVMVLVGRQLDAESQLLDRLEKICACFTASALESVSDNMSAPPLKKLDLLLKEFTIEANKTVTSRNSVLELIGQIYVGVGEVSVRKFINWCPEPYRSQLEQKRTAIYNRINELRIQFAGDSAAVFYSYEFYRRIINGLIGSPVQEQEYCPDGKSVSKNAGQLYEKAC
jgi:hypothetical protein